MRNLWLVARYEFRRMVLRRGYLLGTLAVPLGLALLVGLVAAVAISQENNLPVGYVDPTGLLDPAKQATLPDPEDRVEIRAYPDEASARADLEAERIQAFFVLPPDYPANLATDLYFLEDPPRNAVWREFDDFVRANLIAGLPADVQTRLLEGSEVVVEDLASGRTFSSNEIINFVMPFFAAILFMIATMSAAGYLLRVVADEKENRTMEIMITSLSPTQLIAGKALGLLAAALGQLAFYILAAVAIIGLAAPRVPILQALTVPWDYLGIAALFFFPTYALVAAVMIAIGGVVTEFQQGQQIAGLLNLVFLLPILLIGSLFQNPGNPIMIFLTLFPPTSFMSIMLRWGLGTVPTWQIIAGWLLLAATAIFMIWAAARIFRAGMLRYGQPLNVRGALEALRS